MSICEKITLDVAQKALKKIRPKIDTDEYCFEIITPDQYVEAFDIMSNHFIPDEPICHASNVTWNKDFEKMTIEDLKHNISLTMISRKTGDMVGLGISGFLRRSDTPEDFSWMESKNVKDVFRFIYYPTKEIDIFNRYGVDEIFSLDFLCVRNDYRRHGLAIHIVKAALELAKDLSFTVVKGDCTGNYSQRIFEKHGFETILNIPYNSCVIDGNPIGEKTGAHKSLKIYGIRL
ncbi:DNAT-like protein [Mya arenaria]|uniref:DNAT-like protein n=1 Tax=Mya arenaria TaxID=6604 RepID=A0ABY7FXR5_MYAAR|nr:uncharacterized protein LOC128217064 [Mya arenaria]XP_052779872.1 uncharacterized protein LOC128217064 [Mya arenaria]WAR26775.1 DNAT-like protein [Mya arenaria]